MNNTPLRQQYLDIKRRHRDALLLFRIGDFYEAFDEDARLLARQLDIVLTSKPMGHNTRVPLAGFPHHSLERHLATLISGGHRVAICEQLSNAPVKGETTGRGLIERDVVRVVTPGTVLEPGLYHILMFRKCCWTSVACSAITPRVSLIITMWCGEQAKTARDSATSLKCSTRGISMRRSPSSNARTTRNVHVLTSSSPPSAIRNARRDN